MQGRVIQINVADLLVEQEFDSDSRSASVRLGISPAYSVVAFENFRDEGCKSLFAPRVAQWCLVPAHGVVKDQLFIAASNGKPLPTTIARSEGATEKVGL